MTEKRRQIPRKHQWILAQLRPNMVLDDSTPGHYGSTVIFSGEVRTRLPEKADQPVGRTGMVPTTYMLWHRTATLERIAKRQDLQILTTHDKQSRADLVGYVLARWGNCGVQYPETFTSRQYAVVQDGEPGDVLMWSSLAANILDHDLDAITVLEIGQAHRGLMRIA